MVFIIDLPGNDGEGTLAVDGRDVRRVRAILLVDDEGKGVGQAAEALQFGHLFGRLGHDAQYQGDPPSLIVDDRRLPRPHPLDLCFHYLNRSLLRKITNWWR